MIRNKKKARGSQHSERQIFRNFKMSNFKIMKHELFDFSNLFSYFFMFELFEHLKYIIIMQIGNF